MTSFRSKPTGTRPITEEGKQRSRCNAVHHGLTAETMIGALENAEDYKARHKFYRIGRPVQSSSDAAFVLGGLQALTPDRTAKIVAALCGAGGVLAAALVAEFFIRAWRWHPKSARSA